MNSEADVFVQDSLVVSVQFSDVINAGVLLFGRTIKYCVTNIRRKFPTSLSTLSYKTPVFPTDSTLQYHKSNTNTVL